MKIERRKNAKRNIISGIYLKTFQTLVPFLLRSVMIYKMGMDYVGLDSLFVSVLHVLNLAELGVGNAMVYSMYHPISVDDGKKINALLHLYKKYYRIIGLIVLVAGSLLTPFIDHLISGSVPAGVNIYILYYINLLATVLSYWMFAYKNSLLMAHQRTDITNKINLFSFVIRYSLQFLSLFVFRNIYGYFISILVSQLAANLLTFYITSKMYPDYVPDGELTKEEKDSINKHIKDLFTAKLGGTVTNSADAVIISAFLGLTVLAKYNNYYYILSALFSFIAIIFQSCLAGIGNSIVVESEEKNYNDFKKFSLFLTWVIGYCTACLYCLMQPFMYMWVKEANMLEDSYVILFCLYFYVYEIALIWATYKDAGGVWHKDRFRPLCVTIVNLALNLLTVSAFGLYGVILSTVISYLFVGMPWMLSNIFTTIFKRNPKEYIIKCIFGVLSTVIACVISGFACQMVGSNGILGFIIRLFITTIIANAVFLVFFYKTKEFKELSGILQKYVQRPRK